MRTAVTVGEIIDWITTSPEAFKFTDWSKVVQNAEMPRPLDLDHQLDCFINLVAGHVALVAVFDGAARLDRHRDIDHPGGRRLVQGCLALELGADQIGAASDRTPNQIRADAERVGIGDRWNAGYPLGRPICEFLPVGAGRVEHGVGRYP